MEKLKLTRSILKEDFSPDNSACEGFFGRIKNEFYYRKTWTNREFIILIKIIIFTGAMGKEAKLLFVV